MNERKLAVLRKKAEKRRKLEAQQAEIAAALQALNSKELVVDIPEQPKPEVHIDFDTSELAQIAEQTKAQLEALESKLNAKPTIDTIKAVQGEISGLKSQFEGITKALEQDIYARYDYTNSIEENGVRYIGYLNKDSDWFIQRLGSGTEGETSTFATGKRGGYKQAWKDRLRLTYVLRDKANIA